MKRTETMSRKKLAQMIDAIENDRPIKAVLVAISKGQYVTGEEKERAARYEREKRKKRFIK